MVVLSSPHSTDSLDALVALLKAQKVAEVLELLVVLGSPDSTARSPDALEVLLKA